MKKDRACGMPYPVYGVPMNPNMGWVPASPGVGNGAGIMQTEGNDLVNINNKINSLEKRVSALESLVGNNSNYNPSNYQMM